jgi:hypothetical protein
MIERAKKIMEAYEAEDTYNFPKDGVAAALREVINQLQYDNTDWDAPDDHMIIDVKDILKLIEELEALK